MTPADIGNLRDRLAAHFTDDALRCLCYDAAEFQTVYDQLRADISKPQLINQLLKYAERHSSLDLLSQLANAPQAVDLRALQSQVMAVLGQHTSDVSPGLSATVLEIAEALVRLVLNRLGQDATGQVIVAEYHKAPQVFEQPIAQRLGEALTQDADFAAQVQRDLARYEAAVAAQELLTGTRYEAILRGSGVVTQGSLQTAAKRGIVGSQAETIITGDQNRRIDAETYVEQQTVLSPHDALRPDGVDLQTAYLHHLFSTCQALSLAGIDRKAANFEVEARLELEAVYIALLTLSPVLVSDWAASAQPDSPTLKQISAIAQLNEHPRLVLLGDPGSGKSTFVNFVAVCLAGAKLNRMDMNLARLTAPLPDKTGQDQAEKQPWDQRDLLPVRVILRDFAARGLPEVGETATAQHLWAFIEQELAQATLADYAPLLRQTLLRDGGLLLLDGLDEVPEANQRRAQLKAAVEDFCRVYGKMRVLVTSRPYTYQKQAWQLAGFTAAVLAPFNEGQIRRFIDRWYAHIATMRGLDRDDAQGRAALLKQAVFANDRLVGLAERPLLLTLMASLHAWRGGNLPEKREELYADTVELLLDWWEGPKIVRNAQGKPLIPQPSLIEWLKVPREKVREALNALAFEAQATQKQLTDTADVAESDLVQRLMTLTDSPEVKPRRLIQYLSQRAGLLVPRGVEMYTFPHLTLQEYLAACHLTDQDFPEEIAQLARQDPERWREVVPLAGEKAASGIKGASWQLAEALCWRDVPATGQANEADLWGAFLASQTLAGIVDLSQVSEHHQAKVTRIKAWLVYILEQGLLSARERVLTGQLINQLAEGDPRPGVTLQANGLPDIIWCDIPTGPFLMGAEDQQRKVPLPAYRISRYPVTNAQYQAFVQDQGYHPESYWIEAIAAGYWLNGQYRERTEPYDFGIPSNLANHPVVGVSWYEAVAFCRWLTAQLQRVGDLSREQEVRLPTEAEWEKAARGTDGRIYPWGVEAAANRANCAEIGIGTTSAVGCFPAGSSPYDCLDMAGNVWEWCATVVHKARPYKTDEGRWSANYLQSQDTPVRILRGGAYYNDLAAVQCAHRAWGYIHDLNVTYGFRVVVSLI